MNTDDEAEVVPLLTIPGAGRRPRGELRVCLKRWRGRDSLELRWWAVRGDGHRATVRGACVPIEHLEAFADAVLEAVRVVKGAEGPPS